jgi:hypothetical protein
MSALREAFSWAWDKMNPVEPTIGYLVTFMAVTLTVVGIALIIGTI